MHDEEQKKDEQENKQQKTDEQQRKLYREEATKMQIRLAFFTTGLAFTLFALTVSFPQLRHAESVVLSAWTFLIISGLTGILRLAFAPSDFRALADSKPRPFHQWIEGMHFLNLAFLILAILFLTYAFFLTIPEGVRGSP